MVIAADCIGSWIYNYHNDNSHDSPWDTANISRYWLPCLCHLAYLLSKTFELFSCPILW